MTLSTLWLILIAVLWTGYLTLEGFDFGVGMLLRILGRDEKERRTMLRAIGPHWDGNEVWLLTAGGATFAAFPEWYSIDESGFRKDWNRRYGYSLRGQRCYAEHDWHGKNQVNAIGCGI